MDGDGNVDIVSAGAPADMLAVDGLTPIPERRELEINGAPVAETKNEFVMRKPDASN